MKSKTPPPPPAPPKTDPSRPPGPHSSCSLTGAPIPPGSKFHAALRETPTGIERIDVLPDAWPSLPNKDALLASWLATMPVSEQKKKLFVDDETLLTLFERLQDTTEENKLRFRFVLGLILMRKRLVTYDSQFEDNAQSYWKVKLRGKEGLLDLLNPHLSEDQVGDVAGQLNDILSSDL